MKIFIPVALAAAVLMGASPAHGPAHSVTMTNFAFAPKSLTVAAGDAVTFVNRDEEAHTVVAVNGAFASRGLDTNESWSVRLQKSGTYRYFCSLHPYMKGTIIVVPAKAGT